MRYTITLSHPGDPDSLTLDQKAVWFATEVHRFPGGFVRESLLLEGEELLHELFDLPLNGTAIPQVLKRAQDFVTWTERQTPPGPVIVETLSKIMMELREKDDPPCNCKTCLFNKAMTQYWVSNR